MRNADTISYKYWSPFSAFYNLLGSWLSHSAGGSLGREGTAVVILSSLTQLFKLDFVYWRPVVMSGAFAAVVGYPWIAVVFIFEMFDRTNVEQKLFSVLLAWVGILVTTSLQLPHLFDIQKVQIDPQWGFFSHLESVLVLSIVLGVVGRLYKLCYKYLMSVISKKWFYGLLLSIGVGYFINQMNTNSLQQLQTTVLCTELALCNTFLTNRLELTNLKKNTAQNT